MNQQVKIGINDRLTEEQFQKVSDIAYSEAGLVLVKAKTSMISARLSKRVKSLNLRNFSDYFTLLNSPQGADELPNLLSVLTTNVSHFFREEHHFETLRGEVIPILSKKARKGDRIRIWSAGCSNGQELYSIAMTFFEEFPEFLNYDVRLLGTDIDPRVIETARAGVYSEGQLKGLNDVHKRTFFEPIDDGFRHQVKAEVRNCVTFLRLNLIGEWPMKHAFDVIFCRNVVIYFDEPTQKKLWSRFDKFSKTESWLFLGHSERVQDTTENNFKPCGVTAYRKSPKSMTMVAGQH